MMEPFLLVAVKKMVGLQMISIHLLLLLLILQLLKVKSKDEGKIKEDSLEIIEHYYALGYPLMYIIETQENPLIRKNVKVKVKKVVLKEQEQEQEKEKLLEDDINILFTYFI